MARFFSTFSAFSILLFSTLLVGRSAFAQQALFELIESAPRPTFAEIKHALAKDKLTFAEAIKKLEPKYSPLPNPRFTFLAQDNLPMAFAYLEALFPHATYAFLGRDSALTSDVFEAYFESIGQSGRTVRLNASRSSFGYATSAMLARFLQTNGLDFDPTHKAHPFIIIDSTSFSLHSQSRLLVDAAFKKFASVSISPQEAIKRLNVLNINLSQNPKVSFENGAQAREFLAKQEASVTPAGPTYSSTVDLTTLTYGSEWHGTFPPFEENDDGVFTEPGYATGPGYRKLILLETLAITEAVSHASFAERVKQAEEKLGLPVQRSLLDTSGDAGNALNADEKEFREIYRQANQDPAQTLATYALSSSLGAKLNILARELPEWTNVYFREKILPALSLKIDNFAGLRRVIDAFVPDYEAWGEVIKSLSPQVQTIEGAKALFGKSSTWLSEKAKLSKDRILFEHLLLFKSLGFSLTDFKELEQSSIEMEKDKPLFWRALLPFVKTPKDYIVLTRYLNPNPSAQYLAAMERFIQESLSIFMLLKPSYEEIEKLKGGLQLNRSTLKFIDTQTVQSIKDIQDFQVRNFPLNDLIWSGVSHFDIRAADLELLVQRATLTSEIAKNQFESVVATAILKTDTLAEVVELHSRYANKTVGGIKNIQWLKALELSDNLGDFLDKILISDPLTHLEKFRFENSGPNLAFASRGGVPPEVEVAFLHDDLKKRKFMFSKFDKLDSESVERLFRVVESSPQELEGLVGFAKFILCSERISAEDKLKFIERKTSSVFNKEFVKLHIKDFLRGDDQLEVLSQLLALPAWAESEKVDLIKSLPNEKTSREYFKRWTNGELPWPAGLNQRVTSVNFIGQTIGLNRFQKCTFLLNNIFRQTLKLQGNLYPPANLPPR